MFPLEVPVIVQDGIIVALFATAVGFLLYKKLRKKGKSCPACAGDCTPLSNTPAVSTSSRS
jgi:hypothetical protein